MKRTVLITGTSGGIGKATALAFAAAGWNVAATMRGADMKLFADEPSIRTYVLEVTNPESIARAFTAALDDFGRLDAVVNNAGYAVDGIFEAIDEAAVRAQFETNVFGLMAVTRQAIAVMRPQGGGTIIQVASMGGRLTFPLYSIYHASKWAVEGFSESLSFELRQFDIRVKIIEPGVIKTAFYGKSRVTAPPAADEGYAAFTRSVTNRSIQAGRHGVAPEIVAKTIVRAASDGSSMLRYPVGRPAPLLLGLRKILPEGVFLYLIRRGYGVR